MTRLKIIKSHVGRLRFLNECTGAGKIVGWIPRHAEIPSPYSYGPTHAVYTWTRGRDVIIVETCHKRYEVFRVLERVYATDDEATEVYIQSIKEARA